MKKSRWPVATAKEVKEYRRRFPRIGMIEAKELIERVKRDRLMSAAPELFAALEDAIFEVEVYAVDELGHLTTRQERLVEKLKAAIAKAIGGPI